MESQQRVEVGKGGLVQDNLWFSRTWMDLTHIYWAMKAKAWIGLQFKWQCFRTCLKHCALPIPSERRFSVILWVNNNNNNNKMSFVITIILAWWILRKWSTVVCVLCLSFNALSSYVPFLHLSYTCSSAGPEIWEKATVWKIRHSGGGA